MTTKQNQFDHKAKAMDQNPVIREMALNFSLAITKHMPPSPEIDVMDYGCGSGLIGMHLYKNYRSMIMMDTSVGMLEILKEKIEAQNITNMRVINCGIENAPLEPGCFDLIYTNNVLHHIADIPGFLANIKPLLKTGGHLCIGDLEKEDGTFHPDGMDVEHFGFAEQEVRAYLNDSGFGVMDYQRYYIINKPNKYGEMQQYPCFFTASGLA